MALLALLALLFFAFVNSQQQELGPCDPIDPSICMYPWPNNFWLRPDSVTGVLHLNVSNTTFPIDKNGVGIDAQKGGWNSLDGFSPIGPLATYFADVQLKNVPPYWDMSHSLDSNATICLLDTVTGDRLPYWVELDDSSNHTSRKAILIWPSKSLEHGRRYIVGIRGLVNSTGLLIQASAGFASLRDGTPTNDPDIENRRALFADIFSQLAKVGWQQSTLQLAWDFTVGTQNGITGRLLSMRDDGFSRIKSEGGVQWKIESVTDNYSADIFRHIEVLVKVPQYVDRNAPGATLVLDANGVPVYQGDSWNQVTILIPQSLANGTYASGNILQYGHGLFGSRTECESGYLTAEANLHGAILIATDWLGLCNEDAVSVYTMVLTDLTRFAMVPDRCQQGVLLAHVAMRLMVEGKFANDPAMMPNGRQIITSSTEYYYTGNSEGGILGGVYMATSLDVIRGTLGVGGGPYSLLCPRSEDFVALFDVLKERYSVDPLDRMAAIIVLQALWDRGEPSGYMNFMATRPLPNTPAHQILMQHGLGDAQVTYVGAYTMMRSVGAVMFQSNVNEPNENLYGFPFVPDNSTPTDAVIVTWDFPGIPPVPEQNVPPTDGFDTHEYVRRQSTAQDMMFGFFSSGFVKNTCGGPCHGYIPNYSN